MTENIAAIAAATIRNAVLKGDVASQRLCLEPFWHKNMPIQISGLPLIKTLSDANAAFAVIIKKLARGEICLDDAERASAVIEKAINAIDLKDEVASAVREKKENEK